MEKLGYEHEQTPAGVFLYRDEQGEVARVIIGQKVVDDCGHCLCRNALDLVREMHFNRTDQELPNNYAIQWLKDNFGAERTVAAVLVHQEQTFADQFERERVERERLSNIMPRSLYERDGPDRTMPEPPDRDGPSFDR